MDKFFLRYRAFPFFEQDNGGNSGGGNSGQQQQQNQEDTLDDFWSLDDDGDAGNPPRQNNQQQQNQPDDQSQRLQQQLEQYIASRIPQFEQFSEEEQQAIQNGDMRPVQQQMQKSMAGLYRSMLSDVNNLMNGMKQKIIDEAVNRSGSNVNAQQAISQMHDKLKWTAEPAIAPIAKAALAQQIKKGKSVTEAIAGVEKLFKHASSRMNGGARSSQGFNRGSNGSVNNGNSGEDFGDGDENFLDLLGAGN